MAISTNNLDISALDFEVIKSDLKTYLQTQTDIGKDIGFETGSVSDSLLSVLSYNTLYYAYYIYALYQETSIENATKISSVENILKSIGYTAPGYKSATANIRLTFKPGSSTVTLQKFDIFSSNNESGKKSFIYTGNTQTLSSGYIDIAVTQGTIVSETHLLDANQTYIELEDTNIDIANIFLTVDNTYWTNAVNFTGIPTSSSKVFFVEKLNGKYRIVFGGSRQDSRLNAAGELPLTTQEIVIYYIRSNGTSGNNCKIFTSNNPYFTITTNTNSSGGLNQVDIEYLRDVSPLIFGLNPTNKRIITINDLKGFIATHSTYDTTKDIDTNISVWNGVNTNLKEFGTSYFSVINSTSTTGNQIISDLSDYKAGNITIKYAAPKTVSLAVTIAAKYLPKTKLTAAQLKSGIESALTVYDVNKFFNDVNSEDLLTIMRTVDSALSTNQTTISMTASYTHSLSDGISFGFENEIVSFNTNVFSSKYGSIKLTSSTVADITGFYKIQMKTSSDVFLDYVGKFNPKTGVISLKNSLNATSIVFNIVVKDMEAVKNFVVDPTFTVTAEIL
jgi:hypothetical protein